MGSSESAQKSSTTDGPCDGPVLAVPQRANKSLCETACGRAGTTVGEPLSRIRSDDSSRTTPSARSDDSQTPKRRTWKTPSQLAGPPHAEMTSAVQGSAHRVDARRPPAETTSFWSKESADKVQGAVDLIFGTAAAGTSLYGLEFSFSIADPGMEGCPLIGCSTGFTKLCGYELSDIVGRNCRFLVDPVPCDQIDEKMREHTKEFCAAIGRGETYQVPPCDYEPWMPEGRPSDELFALQRNARKDGSLFDNMFFMKAFDISTDLGKEKPYIIALQSELPQGKQDLEKLTENIDELDAKMVKLKKELSGLFFMKCSISRQAHYTPFDSQKGALRGASTFSSPALDGQGHAPEQLHTAFDVSEVKPWAKSGFKHVKKLAAASRNRGVVWLMQDEMGQYVAVKAMPNSWMQSNHAEFLRAHPRQTELPWQDVGCISFLNSVNYEYACDLVGVFRSNKETFVVSSFASGGDLFDVAQLGDFPSPKREATFAPLVIDIFTALRHLHNLNVAHRDLSLENVLLCAKDDFSKSVKIIDFGMCASGRAFQYCPRGKASYEAPEMQGDAEYDAFLTDAFAAGVLAYALLFKDYPWLSTKPGQCKRFDYVRKSGLRAYCAQGIVRGSQKTIASCASDNLLQLLEGMLMLSPEKRLTLGEKQWTNRKSVWEEPWIIEHRQHTGN